MDHLNQHIESLLFAAEHPLSAEEIRACLETAFKTTLEPDAVQGGLQNLADQYRDDRFSIEIVEMGGGFRFMTKGAYYPTVAQYLKQTTRRRLSQAALETLALIAYKQPASKIELERLRGVSCDYSLQKLLEKELVTITGRSDGPGRPLLYGTTEKFMDYFGIKSLGDLPQPREFKEPENAVGEQAPIEETLEE